MVFRRLRRALSARPSVSSGVRNVTGSVALYTEGNSSLIFSRLVVWVRSFSIQSGDGDTDSIRYVNGHEI